MVLSAVIITKNEQRNLSRCLQSLEGVADEVVVVDSGSMDGTVELAKEAGARVLQRDWTSYADQKNWANQQATHPYILSLDADESLSDALRLELLAWKGNVPANLVAWDMPRLTSYVGQWIRHGGWYPDRKIRLFKAGTGQWGTAHPDVVLHEAWRPFDQHRGALGRFQGDILHHSYHDHSEHLRQWAKFSTLGAKDAMALGKSSHVFKPWGRPVFQWVKQWLIQSGWRDGKAGWNIARWSALSAHWKWRQVLCPLQVRRVAIVRTDALGDNVLTLPMAGALKAYNTGIEVIWICREYARPVANRCTHIDEIRVWSGDDSTADSLFEGLDAVLFAFPEPVLLKAAHRAKVPIRVATGRRIHALRWANRWEWRGRKRSSRHETYHSLRLLGQLHVPAHHRFPDPVDWWELAGFRPAERPSTNDGVLPGVLHVGNHGSATGWALKRFGELARLMIQAGHPVVFTGTKAEGEQVGDWIREEGFDDHPQVTLAFGTMNLDELMDMLGRCAWLVASSTGPLHLAAIQGTPVVGIYLPDRPFWPKRWAPIGPHTLTLEGPRTTSASGIEVDPQSVREALLSLT